MDMPQLAFLFESVSGGEWIVLLAVILIVMGPERLPEMARKLGRWTETFRRAADEFKRQIMTMDQEVHPQEPAPHDPYTDYDHGNGEDPSMHPETDDSKDAVPSSDAPPPALETEKPELQDAYPSEGLPDSAQYYGNEDLVASMEADKQEGEKKA
jgi:TatA/E family protein of Tat protein translocase